MVIGMLGGRLVSLTVIEEEREGSLVIATIGVGVTRRKDIGGHQ